MQRLLQNYEEYRIIMKTTKNHEDFEKNSKSYKELHRIVKISWNGCIYIDSNLKTVNLFVLLEVGIVIDTNISDLLRKFCGFYRGINPSRLNRAR